MNFIDGITNTTYTQNGALTNKSSYSANLDLFSMAISSDYETKKELIKKAAEEDTILSLKVVLYLRDVRNGQGNKDILQALFDVYSGSIPKLFKHIPEIGSFKDLVKIYDKFPEMSNYLFPIFKNELLTENSLCAKWLPRKGKLFTGMAKFLNLKLGEYRRLLSGLSNTVEQQICNNKWNEVNYKSVPSRANKLYANAFTRHDEKRREEFLEGVMSGDLTMNSSRLYPHEIINSLNIHPYRNTENSSANALWKSLPNYMQESKNVLPVIDTSGSMFINAYSNYNCIDIALGLGVYFAEHNTGKYKDIWCNFSTTPNFYKLKGDTLSERVSNIDFNNWSGSTNLQAVFNMILRNSTKEDVPSMILIVSDMEFNQASRHSTNFEEIDRKYKEAGLKRPVLVFWRVDVKVPQQPVTKDENGTMLINGYSPNILKEILNVNLDNITPYKMMLEAIGTKYDYIVKDLFKQ